MTPNQPYPIQLVTAMNISLWLDDARPMPDVFTHHARTAGEAITLLEGGEVTLISLDHDLGNEVEVGSGYVVACWIETEAHAGRLRPIEVRIHSANPVGAARMRAAIAGARKAWECDNEECQ